MTSRRLEVRQAAAEAVVVAVAGHDQALLGALRCVHDHLSEDVSVEGNCPRLHGIFCEDMNLPVQLLNIRKKSKKQWGG